MVSNESAGAADDKRPWTQPGFIVAAAIVILIVILGVIIAFTGGSGDDAHRPTAPAVPATRQPAASSDSSASICGLAAGPQEMPSSLPRTKWELVGRMVSPTAPNTFGPKRRAAGIRSCFSHSPTGALYASVNVVATATDPSLWKGLARHLLAKGPGRDRAVQDVGGEDAAPASSTIQVAGFSFRTYAPEAMTVSLAFRVDAGAQGAFFASLPMRMTWEDGDWKLVVADNGDPFADLSRVPDLSGYVAWSGA
jgi:hypothetical protein